MLVALAITLWGITWLKELQLARKVRVWYVTFPQTGGLSSSDEVQVNGLRKGSVGKVALVNDLVVVDLALASEIALTSDCRVAIRNIGLMGEKVIAVDMRSTGTPYTERDTITGVYEKGIPEVMATLGTTVDAITQLAVQLQNMTSVMEKSGSLDKTLANFQHTSEELRAAVAENRVILRETIQNLNSASRTAKALTTDKEAQLRKALESFEHSAVAAERLTGRLDSLRIVLQSVAGKVDRGEGSLGRLVNDPKLYDDAKESVTQLRALIEDIKKNPKKYLNVSVF